MERKTPAHPPVIITATVLLFVTAIAILVKASFTSRERAQEAGSRVVKIAQGEKLRSNRAPTIIEGEGVEYLGEGLYYVDGYNILYKTTSDTSYIVSVIIDDTELITFDSASGLWN